MLDDQPIGDFQRRKVALVADQSRASGFRRAIWTLVGVLVATFVLALLVFLRADARGGAISADHADVMEARQALALSLQTFRAEEPLPEGASETIARTLNLGGQAGLTEAVREDLQQAFRAIEDGDDRALEKADVTAFVAASEVALDELAAASTALQQRLERARERLLVETSLLVVLALVGLAAALALLLGAGRDRQRLLSTVNNEVSRLSALIAASADGIVTLTVNGRIEAANAQAYRLLGVEPGGLIDVRLCDHVDIARREDASQAFADQARWIMEHEDSLFETNVTRSDGSSFPASVTFSEYDDQDGRRFVATIRDITGRREDEAAKEAFVATVTHELRTPLTSILGSLDLLASKGLGENASHQARRLVEIAQSNAHRLIRLINDILDLEKLEAGRGALDIVELSLRSLAETAIEQIADYASPRSVTFRLNMLEPEVIVRGDRDRLMQVATNLLSNAVKASPEGGVVDVSVLRMAGWGEFAVRDYGEGVPRDFEAQLFKKFAQAEKSKGSTGLGLALVQEIAEQLDGRAYYQRALPTGSIFTIALPLADLDLPSDTCMAGACDIVHLDPDTDTLRIVAHAFAGRARVRSFVEPLEPRDALRRQAPDAVIVDVTAIDKKSLDDLINACGGAPIIGFSSDGVDPSLTGLLSQELVKSIDSLEDLTKAALDAAGADS